MANPIYREVVPWALTSVTELYLPIGERPSVLADGSLDCGCADVLAEIVKADLYATA